MSGIFVLVVGLFLGTLPYSPPPVNGDGTNGADDGDVDGDDADGNQFDDDIVDPQKFLQSTIETIIVSDDIDFVIAKAPVTPGGFRPGIPVGGGGGGGSSDDDEGEEQPPAIFDAIVRVVPDPVPSPGLDVQAFGITNASNAKSAIFELFGPECIISEEDSCAEEVDTSELSPPSFSGTSSDISALCSSSSCEEYSVVFSGQHLGLKGEYRIKATFLDADDNIVAIEGMNFRVQSFFVVPESQIGAIALIVSSIGTLAIVYYAKVRKR